MIIESIHPDITIQARADLDILIIRWLYNNQPSKVKEIYISVLSHCLDLSFNKVLIDIRRRERRDTEIVDWFFNEYVGMVCNKLEKGLKISFLVTPHVKDAIVEENLSCYQKMLCEMSVFDLEQDAVSWLIKD